MNKTTVAISNIGEEQTILRTLYEEQVFETINLSHGEPQRKALLLSAIISDGELEDWLRQHYLDTFGSEGKIPVKITITEQKAKDILDAILDVATENIRIDGYHGEPETYIDIPDNTEEELKAWIQERMLKP